MNGTPGDVEPVFLRGGGDDHALVRPGIRAGPGEGADVVLPDVHLPGGGRAVPGAITSVAPEVAFPALSVSDAAEDVIDVIQARDRGRVTPPGRRCSDGGGRRW